MLHHRTPPRPALPADVTERRGVKASRSGAQSKAERVNAAKQQRDKKRATALEHRRNVGPPRVVALLPLSDDVDVPRLWAGLLAAFSEDAGAAPSGGKPGGMDVDAGTAAAPPLLPTTLSVPDRRRVRFTLLPPPGARDDPLAIVELARCAEVVLLAMPGDVGTHTIDDAGGAALGVLRTMGLPAVAALVQSPAAADGRNVLKERAAAKKHATNALQEQVGLALGGAAWTAGSAERRRARGGTCAAPQPPLLPALLTACTRCSSASPAAGRPQAAGGRRPRRLQAAAAPPVRRAARRAALAPAAPRRHGGGG